MSLLAKIGAPAFEARLRGAGARLVRPRAASSDAGLALALGGEGISLCDLVMLYAALRDDGLAKPLAWTRAPADQGERSAGRRLLRPAAARQVLAILREGPTPKGRAPAALIRGGPGLAFKTGAFYGYRDALAVGVTDEAVIGVWTGRADGGARAGLTGREAALPLLFDIADQLHAPRAAPAPLGPAARLRPSPSWTATGRGLG